MAYFTEKTKTVQLPSDSNYWVKIKSSLKYGDLKGFFEYGGTDGSLTLGEKMKLTIVEWNLDDDKGETLPITTDTIDLLKDRDVEAIAAAYLDNGKDVKKNSSSSSTPTSAAQQ